VLEGYMPAALASGMGHPRSEAAVIVGGGHWLFFNSKGEIEAYRCSQPFAQQDLVEWTEALRQRQAWLAQRGIRYLLVVAPSKAAVYSEYLPRALKQVHPRGRLEQWEDYLAGQGLGELLLNLRPAVCQAKAQHPTFYRTDTHWNEFGGFVGYRELLLRLVRWFPAAQPRDLAEFEVQISEGPLRQRMDLAELLDTGEHFKRRLSETYIDMRPRQPWQASMVQCTSESEREPATSISTNPHAPLGHAVVVHDSFMAAMQPFFNEHWQRVDYIATLEFPCEAIERLRPEIVIQEIAQRYIVMEKPINPPQLQAPSGSEQWATVPETAKRL
jgi:hypothetical protein